MCVELFRNRLTLTIASVEAEDYDQDELEFIIRKLYEFFILGARSNFMNVIASDIVKNRLVTPIENHRDYLKAIKGYMSVYSPLITTFGPITTPSSIIADGSITADGWIDVFSNNEFVILFLHL